MSNIAEMVVVVAVKCNNASAAGGGVVEVKSYVFRMPAVLALLVSNIQKPGVV
jgi:hypothetical protein